MELRDLMERFINDFPGDEMIATIAAEPVIKLLESIARKKIRELEDMERKERKNNIGSGKDTTQFS